MATVTLKNVPERLVRLLKDEARQNRRSLNQEAMARLEASLVGGTRPRADVTTELKRLHKRFEGMVPLTDAFLDRAKREGRS